MPSRATPEPVSSTGVDDATLSTIERRLARYVGPIARHLVRDAARRTASIEALCETVSRNIGQTADRERFIAEAVTGSVHQTSITSVRPPPAAGGGTSAGVNISAVQAERVERALIRALGPIAKLLVKRALPGAASEAALWEQLATHIERPADREAFLRQRNAG
jgi:serine/threonine-protein kinase